MPHAPSSPPVERRVLGEHSLSARGIGFRFAEEDVRRPTDWSFEQPHHTIIVHRAGQLRSMETEFSNGPAARVLPSVGDIWVVPAGQRYAALAQGDTAAYLEITMPVRALGRAAMPPRIAFRDPFVAAIAGRLDRLANRSDDIAGLTRDAIAEMLRLHVLDHYSLGPRRAPPRPDFNPALRLQLIAHLRDTLDQRHTLAGMARAAGMSVDAFASAFAAAFGKSPCQYLIGLRLDEARRLLRETALPVTEIALATGFSTPSHFATSFRQHVGLSPSRYRSSLGG